MSFLSPRLLRALPVLLAAAVAFVAAWLVVGWVRESDRTRAVQVRLAQLDASANHMSTLEWQAIASGAVAPALAASFRDSMRQLDAQLAGLRRLDPADRQLVRQLSGSLLIYERAVSRELDLLRAGRVDAAEKLDEATVDPAFEVLSDQLRSADGRHAAEGVAARHRAAWGSAITLALAALLVGLLLWVSGRSRKRLLVVEAQEDAVRRSERRFRALAQNATDLVIVVDRELTIRYQSESADRVIGPATQPGGRPLTDVVHPDDLPRIRSLFPDEGTTLQGVRGRFECRVRHQDAEWTAFETVAAGLPADVGWGEGLILTSRDIRERKELEAQLRHQAFHDALSGLPNRALFEDRVAHALATSERTGAPVAVLFADLDDFKLVNDTLGHAAGDDLLRVVAQRLRECTRAADTVARLGGDEFAVLLESDGTPEGAQRCAARILEAVRAPIDLEDRQVLPRISVGIATSEPGIGTDVLLRNADVAMYAAKSHGKDGVATFDPSMHASAVRRFELTDQLADALAHGQFEVHYQPIVTLANDQIAGVEALLRWNHPEHGMLMPADFIPLAEQSGAIVPIGRWVLHEACVQAGHWSRRLGGEPLLHVCVNLSTRQLEDPELVAHVSAALEAGRLRPEQLVLELTESLLIQNVDHTRRRLEELKATGVRLAIDDFGTGYSALSYLQSFPLDILKIDQSFIHGLAQDDDRSNIVRALITLSETLELDVVAEGIEEQEELAILRDLHPKFGQGFVFARPMPAQAFTRMLAEPGRSLHTV